MYVLVGFFFFYFSINITEVFANILQKLMQTYQVNSIYLRVANGVASALCHVRGKRLRGHTTSPWWRAALSCLPFPDWEGRGGEGEQVRGTGHRTLTLTWH